MVKGEEGKGEGKGRGKGGVRYSKEERKRGKGLVVLVSGLSDGLSGLLKEK